MLLFGSAHQFTLIENRKLCLRLPPTTLRSGYNNALAIVGNATVINDQAGYLTFWPNGAAQPLVASSNFAVGQILNRHFTVGLGATGMFNIFASAQTDLIVDVSGFFAP